MLRPARCAHCSKINFARTIVCISCTREVDEDTEYLDSSEYQKQRHQGMLKLARSLEPSLLQPGGDGDGERERNSAMRAGWADGGVERDR